MSNEAGKDELEEINLETCYDSSLLFSQILNHELERKKRLQKFVRYPSLPDTVWHAEGFLVNSKGKHGFR